MQTFLIVGKDKEKVLGYAKRLCQETKVASIDIDTTIFEGAVKIEDVRNFQKKLFLKPIKSKTKALILDSQETLTDEAQNALLKVLEEPPNNTMIILMATSLEIFLPTVLSRCHLIDLETPSKAPIDHQPFNILISLFQAGIGERLKFAQNNSKTKEDAKKFLENLILSARQNLIKKAGARKTSSHLSISYDLNLLISLTKTHKIISTTNANPRLALENLFLFL